MNFAFITHSLSTYPNDSPEIDDARLARKKRRRTSPEDLAVLEEEYQKCEKPTRQMRLCIANRVNMEERAVQIWFQNKRQQRKRSTSPKPGMALTSRLEEIKAEGAVDNEPKAALGESSPNARKMRRSSSKVVLGMSDCGQAKVMMVDAGIAKRKRVSRGKENIDPAKPEGMDECVEGLLSLSNGQWR